MSDLFGQQGQQLLERVGLSPAARARVNSAQRIITALDLEIDTFAQLLAQRLRRDPGCTAIQQIPGVGPVLTVHCGRIIEQGSRLVRWAAVKAVQHGCLALVHVCALDRWWLGEGWPR